MRIFKVLIILILVALILGGGFGAYYLFVLKPKQEVLDSTVHATGQPTPDPSTPDFERAASLRGAGQFNQAREALNAFLTRYPESSHRQEAENLLGAINLEQAFSPEPGPDKVIYTVKSGDNLDKVARHTKANAELIYRASKLEKINLQIGQKLIIPQLDLSIEAHLNERRVILLNHGQFFRSYPIINLKVPGKKNIEIKTKVGEKRAFRNNVAVAPFSKEYPGSLRQVIFAGQPGYTIYGEPGEGSVDKPPTNGIGLGANEAEELHTLVPIGTPATISSE